MLLISKEKVCVIYVLILTIQIQTMVNFQNQINVIAMLVAQ